MEKTTHFIECKQWLDSVAIQKLFSLRQFLVQETGLGAVTLRARQYIAITPQLSPTAVRETLLEQETFLSLLNPNPRTETPPHHVLPVLLTVCICKHAFFGLLCYSGSQPGCPETTLGNDSFWEGENYKKKKKSFQTQQQSSISNTASLIWLRKKMTRQLISKIH